MRGSERTPGVRVGMRWWDQAGINMSGAREAATAAAESMGEKSNGGDAKEDYRYGATVTSTCRNFN